MHGKSFVHLPLVQSKQLCLHTIKLVFPQGLAFCRWCSANGTASGKGEKGLD